MVTFQISDPLAEQADVKPAPGVHTLFGLRSLTWETGDAVVCHTEISGRANIKFKNETHFKSLKMIACAASRRTSSPYEQVRLSR